MLTLLAAAGVIGALGGLTIGRPLVAGAAAVAVAGAVIATLVSRSGRRVLAQLGAHPADPATFARLHNVVEGLCVAAGLPKPGVYVVEDPAPNALAVGRDPQHAVLVVTTGLVDKLDRMELEGVVAHELSHIKSGDMQVSTIAANFLGALAPGLAARLAPPRRELLADVNGVALTRYPPGLAAALQKLHDDPARPTAGGRAVAHLWIETPEPPLEERIAALLEL